MVQGDKLSDDLHIMITSQHRQLMEQSRILGWLAVASVMSTLAVFIAAAVCAVFNPAAAILLTVVLCSAPFTIISGAVLFWQCKKRQKEAYALIMMVADQVHRESAIALSTSIDNVSTRDQTKSQLSMHLATCARPSMDHQENGLVSGFLRKLVGESSA
jgi:hypothetical protein